MKANESVNLKSGKYALLMKHKKWRVSLGFYVVLILAIFTYIVYSTLVSQRSWTYVALPIIGVGLVFLLFPLTEEWFYGPWQGKNQRYERHIRG